MNARRIAAAAGAVGLALLVGVAGCSSGADESSSSNAGRGVQRETLSGGGAQAPAPAAEVGAPEAIDAKQAPAPAKFRTDPRAIVYNGSITVRVDSPEAAAGRATGIATGAGGFVGSDKRTSDSARSEATLTLRVPAARFGSVVDELARLGKEESRGISTEDVTEQVVDLDARIASQRASVTRTRALLAQAKTIGEIVSVESELAKREGDLGALEARKRNLDDLTTLSTITVTLLGPQADAPVKPGADAGFLAGLKAGWRSFVASMQVLLTVLGALLPWLVLLGAPIVAAIWLARRLNRRPPAAPIAAPAAGGSGSSGSSTGSNGDA
jgi:hypothetical protein